MDPIYIVCLPETPQGNGQNFTIESSWSTYDKASNHLLHLPHVNPPYFIVGVPPVTS